MMPAYRIAGNFRGRKLSRISRFFSHPRKFSPRNSSHATPIMRPVLTFRESFLREMLLSYRSAKVFSLQNFPLYGMRASSSTVVSSIYGFGYTIYNEKYFQKVSFCVITHPIGQNGRAVCKKHGIHGDARGARRRALGAAGRPVGHRSRVRVLEYEYVRVQPWGRPALGLGCSTAS